MDVAYYHADAIYLIPQLRINTGVKSACTCGQHTLAFYAKYAISLGALLLAQFFVLIWTPTVGRFDALSVRLTEFIF